MKIRFSPLKTLSQKIFLAGFIAFLAVLPVSFAYAQSSNQDGLSASGFVQNNQQATANSNSGNSAGSSIAAGAASCSVGQILANLLSSTVSTGISAIKTAVSSQISGQATGAVTSAVTMRVPVEAPAVNAKIDITNNNGARLNAAKVGGGQTSDILGAVIGGIGDVSWDSIAYCIANEMIKYIAQSTIQWIQSGFKGQPVFVDNPERFFQNIADKEAGSFVQQLVGGATGINVCQPFKVQLVTDTINSYNSGLTQNRRSGLNCSLSTIKNNYNQFVGGNFNAGGIPGWFELIQPQNNLYGSRIAANQEALLSVSTKQNTATVELNWAHGYKSFKICDGGYDANGNCPSGERTGTPGQYIESVINTRAASPQHRLELATQFDQVVSALVNELIKIAVNKVFEKDGSNQN